MKTTTNTSSVEDESQISLLSIGGLAKSSGIPVETLRNWERRYGFPSPERRDSGHRRYPLILVPKLVKIKRAIDQGYKPSFAVNASDSDLDTILDTNESTESSTTLHEWVQSDEIIQGIDNEIGLWLDKVLQMDAHRLTHLFRKAWDRIGVRHFINQMVVPFLHRVGRRWEEGRFTVAHEHFASEVLQGFLSSHWRPMSSRSRNGKVVVANLEGEYHSLRLHLAAVFLVLHDFEPVFLGPNTPADDIIAAATEIGVHSVVIGLSPCSNLKVAQSAFNTIIDSISKDVFFIFGGNEHFVYPETATYIDTFEEFDNWCGRQATAN